MRLSGAACVSGEGEFRVRPPHRRSLAMAVSPDTLPTPPGPLPATAPCARVSPVPLRAPAARPHRLPGRNGLNRAGADRAGPDRAWVGRAGAGGFPGMGRTVETQRRCSGAGEASVLARLQRPAARVLEKPRPTQPVLSSLSRYPKGTVRLGLPRTDQGRPRPRRPSPAARGLSTDARAGGALRLSRLGGPELPPSADFVRMARPPFRRRSCRPSRTVRPSPPVAPSHRVRPASAVCSPSAVCPSRTV